MIAGFDQLTPDRIIAAVERATASCLTGLTAPMPSYINRVYELETVAGQRLIAKFYRPGRWDRAAILDEHGFVADCATDDIPVVAPLTLADGTTLGRCDEMFFALFPKRSGREMALREDEGWRRLGALVGRIHLAGSRRSAEHRWVLHPETTTLPQIRLLEAEGFASAAQARRFGDLARSIVEVAVDAFDGVELQRIHGDCHRGNLLERPGEGLMVIDFDDMFTGPAVQDLWLLLPGHAREARREIDLILEGYEQFMEFDDRTLGLIEILRAMRMIYFLGWCSLQRREPRFQTMFPDWGSEWFWRREIADLEQQYQRILDEEGLNQGGFL